MFSYHRTYHRITRIFLLILPVSLVLAGCRSGTTPAPSVSPQGATPTFTIPVATTAAPTPSATPEPLAVQVNGVGVSIAEYEAEFRQIQEAHQTLGKTVSAEEQQKQVLDNFIDTILLAQAAYEKGFQVEESSLQAEIDKLSQQLAAQSGGSQGLQEWMAARGYSEATFRTALKRSLAAAWQRDQITASVPTEAEQIHARQILTQDEDIANRALDIVKQPGINFAAYALQYDQLTSGDLGWFPRGYLTQPEVEEAVFQLQPGQISPVIKSQIGYHIIQVISREPSRLISPDARRVLQHKALQDWLKASREGGQIEVLLP